MAVQAHRLRSGIVPEARPLFLSAAVGGGRCCAAMLEVAMLKRILMTAALLAAGQSAQAQQANGAGALLQQIPPPPVPEKAAPDIRVQRSDEPAPAAAAGARIEVRSLHVTGATLFTEAQLIAASGFTAGSQLSLAELRAAAARISAFYNSHGFFLARAYLPEQDIRDATVTIAVIEGRYGKIDLHNRTNLRPGVARAVLDGLDSGDVVATAPLERRLLLLSDIPGVAVGSTLIPGTTVGTSDLLVDLAPGRRVTGSVEADNSGSRYTGAYRFGGTVNLNDPTGHGDVLSLRVLASNSGLVYGRASYQALFGITTLGVSYAHLHYDLGREFKSLDAHGTADVASVYGSYPLIRSRDANLYALANLDLKAFHDEVDLTSSSVRRRTRVATFGLSGDERDGFGGGGSSVYSLGFAVGNLDIRTPLDRAADALTARSNGRYGKLQFSVARLQTVAGPLSLYGAVRGQVATDNLDISEKMELGGAYGVRAYPEGEAYGDEGYLATAEARLLLPEFGGGVPGRVQLIGFVDVGAVKFAHDPWFAGTNHAHRSGYGAGLRWAIPNNLVVSASYARKLGSADATSAPDRGGRFWFQIAKLF